MKNYTTVNKQTFMAQSSRLVLDLSENRLKYPQSRELTIKNIGNVNLLITSETIRVTIAGILRNSQAAETQLKCASKVAIIQKMINSAEVLLLDDLTDSTTRK